MDHIKSCPRLSEEGVNRQVDERGKLEQKAKNGNKCGRNEETIFTERH